ncbi:hypothetical protein RBI80_00325 [Klebsiella variicola]|nr:hypothetical protein RBI80_00325 [Klebsiella variicola]
MQLLLIVINQKILPKKTICSDKKLSEDDEVLAKVYNLAKKVAHNKNGFDRLTKDLWDSRDLCTDYKCINDWYDTVFVAYDSVIKTNASDEVLNNIQKKYDESITQKPAISNGAKNKKKLKIIVYTIQKTEPRQLNITQYYTKTLQRHSNL